MKKLSVILALCVLMGMTGCNSVEESDATFPDHNITAETPDTTVPAIMVDGEHYYTTGSPVPMEVDSSVIQTATYVDNNKAPEQNGEINFPVTDAKYAVMSDTEKYVVISINEEWIRFEKREEEADSEIERARLKIQEKNDQIAILNSMNKEYLSFIDQALEYLDDDELTEISSPLFKYTLTINDQPIPKDGKITLEEGPVVIQFTSEVLTSLNLPQLIYEKGRLSGDYYVEHLDFAGQKPDTEEILDGTVVQSIIYTFGKDNPLNGLEFTLTEELKERLELETTTMNVTITD